jgi:hypothetical protein
MFASECSLRFLWGPRAESLDACAARLYSFTKELAAINPNWRQFTAYGGGGNEFKLGASKKAIAASLQKGQNRYDTTGEPIPDLGYSLTIVNELDPENVSFGISCGTWSEYVPNVVSCPLPVDESETCKYDIATLLRLCRGAIKIWSPDHGAVYYHAVQEQLKAPGRPDRGRMDHVSDPSVHATDKAPPRIQLRGTRRAGRSYLAEERVLAAQQGAHRRPPQAAKNRVEVSGRERGLTVGGR